MGTPSTPALCLSRNDASKHPNLVLFRTPTQEQSLFYAAIQMSSSSQGVGCRASASPPNSPPSGQKPPQFQYRGCFLFFLFYTPPPPLFGTALTCVRGGPGQECRGPAYIRGWLSRPPSKPSAFKTVVFVGGLFQLFLGPFCSPPNFQTFASLP